MPSEPRFTVGLTPKRGAPPGELITRAELSRRLRVSKTAVSKETRRGGRIHAAIVGSYINAQHPTVVRWQAIRDAATADYSPKASQQSAERPPAAPAPEATPQERAQPDELDEGDGMPNGAELDNIGGDLGEASRLTLGELVERHATCRGLREFLRARRDLEEARKSAMIRMRTQGRLIPLRTVELAIAHLDGAFRLLLSDAPRAIAVRVAPDNAATTAALIRDLLSQHLERAKVLLVTAIAANDPLAPIAAPAEPIPVTPADQPYTEDA